MNIEIITDNKCTGCFACANVCPKKCISIRKNEEGFLFSKVNESECIDCGKCVKICPAHNEVKLSNPITVYAATGKNQEEIKNSSSGGAFFLFAQHIILEAHGYVCGAVLDGNLELRHIVTNNMNDVFRMQGSKYIQSDISECIPQIIKLCEADKKVLFCGTPCQVAALESVIKKNRDNLITLDLICHGVPSAKAFSKYIKKYYPDKEYDNFTFRQRNKFVLTVFAFLWTGNKKRIFAYEDPFFQAFLDGHNYRENCYSCRYAKAERAGDITIGDCANGKAYFDFIGKPISTIALNSKRGEWLWERTKDKMLYTGADYEKECKLNKQLHRPVKRTSLRDNFYTDLTKLSKQELDAKYCAELSLKEIIKQFLTWNIPAKIRYKIIRWVRR